MGVNEDTFNMLKGIFEEQRELTNDEMKAYKDMLHRKEKDMELIKGSKTPLKNAVAISDDVGVMTVETAIKHIRRALDVPNRDGFALVDDDALFKALEILTYVHIVMKEEDGE